MSTRIHYLHNTARFGQLAHLIPEHRIGLVQNGGFQIQLHRFCAFVVFIFPRWRRGGGGGGGRSGGEFGLIRIGHDFGQIFKGGVGNILEGMFQIRIRFCERPQFGDDLRSNETLVQTLRSGQVA